MDRLRNSTLLEIRGELIRGELPTPNADGPRVGLSGLLVVRSPGAPPESVCSKKSRSSSRAVTVTQPLTKWGFVLNASRCSGLAASSSAGAGRLRTGSEHPTRGVAVLGSEKLTSCLSWSEP
eukprot:2176216-Prymnesium_polylepis.1